MTTNNILKLEIDNKTKHLEKHLRSQWTWKTYLFISTLIASLIFVTIDLEINFIELLAKESGLPVGIKSAIGKIDFWEELAKKITVRNEGPDFISIDGGEGGTGAAPLAFADHVSLPFKIGFKIGVVVWICLTTGQLIFDGIKKKQFATK